MSFWLRLLQALGIRVSAESIYYLDGALLQSLQTLADEERRPGDEIAADIIASAVSFQDTSQELWQRWSRLSPREQQVAMMICHNYTTSEMAAQLMMSTNTLKSHIRKVLRKFDVHGRVELRDILTDFDFDRLMDQ
jgi:DNA-binding CsgD family transcriptional regulator